MYKGDRQDTGWREGRNPYQLRGQDQASRGCTGSQGARGGLQVGEEVQRVQHQQLVDQYARHD